MNEFVRSSRSDFLRTLQRAFKLSMISRGKNGPSFEELSNRFSAEKNDRSRRDFIQQSAKAGLILGLAGFTQACSKMEEGVSASLNNGNVSLRRGRSPRIAIIGGGIAGLTCAYELKKYGLNATIYEASTRVGGRIFTKQNFVGNGLTTECGGEFIDTKHRTMLQLAREFNLPLYDTLSRAEADLERDSFCIDGNYYTETQVMDAFAPYANRIAADVSSLPNYFGYDNYNADVFRFDQISISGYFDSIGLPSNSFLRKGLETAYVTEYGLEVNDQTAINFLYLFYINPGNNSFDIFGISDERYKIQGGNERLVDALLSHLASNIILNSSLAAITVNSSNVYTLSFNSGSDIQADIVILTIPFSVLRNVDLSQMNLPSWKTNAIQHLGYGTNAKLIMGFNERKWRSFGHSGYIFTNGSPQFSAAYIQTGWDSSQLQPSTNGSYTVFQGGQLGASLNLGQAQAFLDQLESLWPGTASQFNGTARLIHWPSWSFSMGSYSCWRVGQVTSIKGAEYAPVNNLFFAGEHTSSANQGYMEGGAETGMKVAKAIAVKVI